MISMKLKLGIISLALALIAGGFFLYLRYAYSGKNNKNADKNEKKVANSSKQEKKDQEENKQETVEESRKQDDQDDTFIFSTVDNSIYEYRAGDIQKLTQGTKPHYSPDGKSILFLRDTNNDKIEDEIWVREVATKKETKAGNGCCADWSVNNSQIICARLGSNGFSLFKKSIDGGVEKKIKDNIYGLSNVDCSPSGEILLEIAGGESESEIYSINIDGSQHKLLLYGWKPSWMKDSNKLLYCQNSQEPPNNISIFSYDLTTKSSHEVTIQENDNLFAFSVMGKDDLLYARQRNGQFEICLMNMSNKAVQVLKSMSQEIVGISSR